MWALWVAVMFTWDRAMCGSLVSRFGWNGFMAGNVVIRTGAYTRSVMTGFAMTGMDIFNRGMMRHGGMIMTMGIESKFEIRN